MSSSSKCSFFILLALLLAAAMPLAAATSTFYVLGKEMTQGGVDISTELTVVNPTLDVLSFTVLVLPAGIDNDGTERPDDAAVSVEVPPLQTKVMTDLFDVEEALLEITGPEELVFTAQLIPRMQGERRTPAQLPVMTSETLFNAGQSAYVQNIEGTTNLGVAILADNPATCNYSVRFASGELEGNYQYVHAPLSSIFFRDVLELIGDVGRSYVRIKVICDRDFYVFGDLVHGERGELATLFPSQTGLSTLRPPGEIPVCPSNATCWDLAGPYIPRGGEEHLEANIPLPSGVYEQVRLQMDVTHGGWNGGGGGLYNILYLAFNKSWQQTIAYMQFKQSDQIYFRHGIDPQGDKTLFKRTVGELVPGETYHLDYLFDMKNGSSEMVVTTVDGVEVTRFRSAPRVGAINIGSGGFGFLELSLPRNSAFHLDRASYGWVYDNLHIEFVRR